MAGVIGVGGIFIKFKEPNAMKTWYQEVLGMITNDYGVLFEFGGSETSKAYMQLGTFEDKTDYFGKNSQQYMVNFRVDDLEAFHKELLAKDVTIVDSLESYSYGKFLHIEDPEGNRIELWEAVDKEFGENEKSIMPMR